MCNPSFPNPAEVCKSRGWQVGDKIRVGAVAATELEIMCITDDSIGVLDRDGLLHAMGPDRNITHRTKAEPVPVVTVEADGGDDREAHLKVGSYFVFTVRANLCREQAYSDSHNERVMNAMLEAGKAAIEADLNVKRSSEPVKAGPYKARCTHNGSDTYEVVSPTNDYGIDIRSYDRTHEEFGGSVIDEIVHRHAREIAAELNALHAAKSK